MSVGLIGKKLGMTQVFDEDGAAVPVTAVQAGPCTVVQIKAAAGADGYNAVQLGFGERQKGITSPARGHVEKHLGDEAAVPRELREFRVADPGEYESGQTFDVEIFAPGQMVDVSGISKGKGFAGVMKRHNFSGQQKTHGQSDRWRAPGAVGMGTTPGRVWKGKKMAGRMGTGSRNRTELTNCKRRRRTKHPSHKGCDTGRAGHPGFGSSSGKVTRIDAGE